MLISYWSSRTKYRAFRFEKYPTIQPVTVGPAIDLYGTFAAEKLARLMELYPDRVYSKPEFTALPPYLFSSADFTSIPSCNEPFGLVSSLVVRVFWVSALDSVVLVSCLVG